jgi:hypothetical protein
VSIVGIPCAFLKQRPYDNSFPQTVQRYTPWGCWDNIVWKDTSPASLSHCDFTNWGQPAEMGFKDMEESKGITSGNLLTVVKPHVQMVFLNVKSFTSYAFFIKKLFCIKCVVRPHIQHNHEQPFAQELLRWFLGLLV